MFKIINKIEKKTLSYSSYPHLHADNLKLNTNRKGHCLPYFSFIAAIPTTPI